jgi:hypothetical protein
VTGLGARVIACFVEPSERAATEQTAPSLVAAPPCGAVLGGGQREVVPVAAAVAGELRLRTRTPAAVVALWHPDAPLGTPAGAATPAARRLAARLAAKQPSQPTACGRLAWLALPCDPAQAAASAARAVARAGAPVVLALCGPRPPALEPLLATQDVAVAVLPSDADPDLRTLALAGLPTPVRTVQAPLAPGPPRWAALLGLARLRSLPPIGREAQAAA